MTVELSSLLQVSTLTELREIGVNFNGSQLQKARRQHPTAPIFALLDPLPGATLREKAYRALNANGTCKQCSKPTAFLGINKGFATYCSRECVNADAALQAQLVERRQATMFERYGAKTTLQAPQLRDKVQSTLLHRHGSTNVGAIGAPKRTMTNQRRYGGPAPSCDERVAGRCGANRRAAALTNKLQQLCELGFELLDENWVSPEQELQLKCSNGHTFTYCLSRYQRPPVCRNCTPAVRGTSATEQEIQTWLEQFDKGLMRNYRLSTGKRNYIELDAYLPTAKLAVEFNGLHWHSELAGKGPAYHLDKLTSCENAGIQLIQIFEHEWEERQNICKSVLRSKLDKVARRLVARKLQIVELNASQRTAWFEATHLAGDARATYCIGLAAGDEIVAAASFTADRFGRDKQVIELVRFSVALNTSVAGGLSRLVVHAQRQLGFKVLRSFCDRRWSTGRGYLQAGFILTRITPPTYLYFTTRPAIVSHRSRYQKQKLQTLLPGNQGTEWQLAQQLGLNRFWDCGNFVFERKFK